MRLDPTITRCFPKLAAFIEQELPPYRHRPQVFDAFVKYSQLSRRDAVTALTFGASNPIIDARILPDAFGVYIWKTPVRPTIFSEDYREPKRNNKIFLSRAMCRDFEELEGDYKIVTNIDFIVKVTILHEMVHWGDLKDGAEQPDVCIDQSPCRDEDKIDVGFQFELEAFGEMVSRENWRQYRKRKLNQ